MDIRGHQTGILVGRGRFCGNASRLALLAGASLTLAGVFSATAVRAQGSPETPTSAAATPKAAPDPSSSSTSVGEVVVTARHAKENLQSVPLSIGVVTGALAQEEHVDTLRGVSQLIPNFDPTIVTPRVAGLAIRGIGSGILNGNGDGAQSGVGYIVDNVFLTYVGFSWPDLVDFDNIEVARGPQGTLLGKNTTVGAVIVNTQLPSFTQSLSSETTYGNYNRVEERLNVSGPIIDDKLAGRLTFFGDWGDGFYKNIGPGTHDEQFNDENRFGVRGQLYFTPDATLSDRVIFHYDQSYELDTYPAIYSNGFSTYSNGSAHETYAQKILQLYGVVQSTNKYVGNVPIVPPDGVGTFGSGISNELNKDFGWAKLTSISAFEYDHVYPHNGIGDNGIQDQSSNTYDVNVQQYSQETRLAGTGKQYFGQNIDWQVGSYLLHERLSSTSINIFGNQAGVFYANSAAENNATLNGVTYQYAGTAITESAAIFGQATWHLTSRFDFTAGVRDTYEHVVGSDVGSYYGGVQNLNAADEAFRLKILQSDAFSATGQGFSLSEKKDNNAISFLVNPSYRITNDILLYGSYAQGKKSGAVDTTALPIYSSNGTTILGNYPVITKPESSDDYEIGIKTAWLDRTLTVNLNLYDDRIHQYQAPITDLSFTDPVNGQPLSKTYLSNVPEVELKGLEFETSYTPIHGLSFHADAAYTDDRYVSFPNAAPPADLQYSGGPKTISLNGDRLLNVAPWTGNVGFNLDRPLGAYTFQGRALNFFAYGNLFLSAKVPYSYPQSTYPLFQPAYNVLNIGGGLKTSDNRYSLEVWAKNVGQTRYVYGQITLGSTNGPPTEYLGAPRTFGVTVKVKL